MEKAKKILALALAAVLFLSNINPLYARADNSETASVSSETTAPVTVEATESRDPAETSSAATVTEPAETTVPAVTDEPEPSQVETEETTASTTETTAPSEETAPLSEETTAPSWSGSMTFSESDTPSEDGSGLTEDQKAQVQQIRDAFARLDTSIHNPDAKWTGDALSQLDQELTAVKAEIDLLAGQLGSQPDPEAEEILNQCNEQYSALEAALSKLDQQFDELTNDAEGKEIGGLIDSLPPMSEGVRLENDVYTELQSKAAAIGEKLTSLEGKYPGFEILSAEEQTAYALAQKVLALGPAVPDLSLLPGLDAGMNDGYITLKFQWNDHRNGIRPSGPLFGFGLPDETGDNAPAANVMVQDGGECLTLYDFYRKILKDQYGYTDENVINEFIQAMRAAPGEDIPDTVHGSHVNLTWEKGKLLTAYTDKDGNRHTVSYRLAPAKEKLTGENTYLLTQEGDPTAVLATSTRGFDYNVVWYDNQNRYIDENQNTARPSTESYIKSNKNADGKELDGFLEVIRVKKDVDKSDEILPGTDFSVKIDDLESTPGSVGDTWKVSLSELPIYAPDGSEYRYWVRQTSRSDGNVLNTALSTGAYYTQQIVNTDLVDVNYPNAITNGSTVYNILSRQGKITIHKVWEDGGAASRPKATLHFFREVEPSVVTSEKTEGSDTETVIFHGFDGSPVGGYDSVVVDSTADSATITVPTEANSFLPMFDPYGRRYIYYCVETMEDESGDYEAVVSNQDGGPVVLPDNELEAVRDGADDENIILNGSTVTNRLKKQIEIPVEVDFKAQAIQNDMDLTSVELQLQYRSADGSWVNYDLDKDYDGKLTLDFAPEIMTSKGKSKLVDKYDEHGNQYEYRWVQTAIHVIGGTSGELSGMPDSWGDNPDEVKKIQERVPVRSEDQEIGPGIGGKKTTLLFDVTSTNPEKEETQVITNILVGDTQVEARKTWIYTTADGTTYSTANGWDGGKVEDVEGIRWPNEFDLTFQVRRNGEILKDGTGSPVAVTMPAGTFVADLDGLPRYDENGNEYSYTLAEAPLEGGWVSTWEHSASVVYLEEKNEYVLQKATAFENRIGPGDILTFEVTKHWLDDTDLDTRRPITVGVFRLTDAAPADNSPKATATMTADNNYNVLITIAKDGENDTVANYVLKEISMSGVPVTDESGLTNQDIKARAVNFFQESHGTRTYFITNRHADPAQFFDRYRVGSLGKNNLDTEALLEFQYNVYLTAEDKASGDFADYHIFNQRTAEMTVQLNKIWINDGQPSTATFYLHQLQDGYRCDKYQTETLTAAIGEDGQNTASCSFEHLPKYDATGVLYEYEVEEYSMTVDGKTGEEYEAIFQDEEAMVTGVGRSYRYVGSTTLQNIELAQSEWLKNPEGISPHHSGDVYTWESTNTRQNTKSITIHKVWRDGAGPQNTQDPVTRPDISFHLYRISHAALRDLEAAAAPDTGSTKGAEHVQWMINSGLFRTEAAASEVSGVERVNGNVFWSTSTDTQETSSPRNENNWHWECSIAESVPLFDENGSPYVYFVYEYMRGNAYGYAAHYDNTSGHDGADYLDPRAGTTEGTFAPLPQGTATTTAGETSFFEDCPFLVLVDGENANDYYPCIVVNTRQRDAVISGKKTWNFGMSDLFLGNGGIPYDKMPSLTLRLWRDTAEMKGPDSDGKYTFVPAKWNLAENIDTISVKGSDGHEYAYEFKIDESSNYPRYDEYGYRYSYWLTEDPITGFESDHTLLAENETSREKKGITPPSGKDEESEHDNNRGQFDITNTYKIQPPYVTVDLAKDWAWPSEILDGKKSITVTFTLCGVMVDAEGNRVGKKEWEPFAKVQLTVKEENGKLLRVMTDGTTEEYPADGKIHTFETANIGIFAGQKLPYIAPNGRPYMWYVQETDAGGNPLNGYEITPAVTKQAPQTSGTTETPGGSTRLRGDPSSTDWFLPALDSSIPHETASGAVKFENFYDGGGTGSLTIQKKWHDESYADTANALTSLRDPIKVKLYRQWLTDSKEWAWEQVKQADVIEDAAGWDQMDDDGTLTLTPPANSNTCTLNPLTGLYRFAPSGKLYQYFVVEEFSADGLYKAPFSSDNHPEVSPSDGMHIATEMKPRQGYSTSVTLANGSTHTSTLENTLWTKSLTVSKDWDKQLSDGTSTDDLTVAEAKELKALGILPEKIHFFIQYSSDGGTSWYFLPADPGIFAPAGASSWDTVKGKIDDYRHITHTIDDTYINGIQKVQDVTVNNLPAYCKDGSSRAELSYRWVEVMDWGTGKGMTLCDPVDGLGSGDVHSSHEDPVGSPVSNSSVVEKVSQIFTNTIPVKPLVLRKVWVGDNANRDNTRPDQITIQVSVKQTDTGTGSGSADAPAARETALSDPAFQIKVTLTQKNNVGSKNGYVYESPIHYVPAAMIRDGETAGKYTTSLTATEIDCPDNYILNETPLPFTKGTSKDGKEVYLFTATNTFNSADNPRKTIDLSAEKLWKEDTVDSCWSSITRPTVRFTLQYSYKQSQNGGWTEWKDAGEDSTGVKAEDVTKTVTANAAGRYTVSWNGVYAYFTEDGSAIALPMKYRVVESMVDITGTEPYAKPIFNGDPNEVGVGYYDENYFDGSNTTTITNTLKTVKPSVTKEWKWIRGTESGAFSDDQLTKLITEGILPTSLRFELYYRIGNGVETRYMTGSGDTAQPYTVDVPVADLLDRSFTVSQEFPQYDKNGNTIFYELREVGAMYGSGATATYLETDDENHLGSFTVSSAASAAHPEAVTVTNTLPVGSLTVTKTWDDMDNRDGLRPDEITVTLLRDGTEYDTVVLNAGNGWQHTWNDLPLCQAGSQTEKSQYTVRETEAENYDAEGTVIERTNLNAGSPATVADLFNVHVPATLSVSAQKVWDDQDDCYALRPDSVKFQLQYNSGTAWVNVPWDAGGFEGNAEVSFSGVTGGTMDGSGTVTAAENADGTWPVIEWSGLPAYANGRKVEYKVIEVQPPKCYRGTDSAIVTYPAPENPVEVLNSLITTRITVEKSWEDQDNYYATQPENLTFKVQSRIIGGDWTDVLNGDGSPRTVTMTNSWEPVTFEGLLARDAANNILHYRVVEVIPYGYKAVDRDGSDAPEYAFPEHGTAKFINALETVDLSVAKLWEDQDNFYGTRPEDLSLTVSYQGADGNLVPLSPQPKFTWEKLGNAWATTLSGLPKFIPGTDTEARYTVTETVPTGYTSSAEVTGLNTELTNTLITVDFAGAKIWDDKLNQDGIRPESITVRLYDGEKEIAYHTVTENENWSWSFQALPKYHTDGGEVRYTVKEDPVEGYEAEYIAAEDPGVDSQGPKYKGMDIRNTHLPEKISVSVTKSWKDWGNADRLRPESVTIHLLADGKDTGEALILSKSNGWSGSFEDLDRFREGKEIVYTVTEDKVPKYETAIKGSAQEGFTVVNSHTPAFALPKTGDDPLLPVILTVLLLSAGGLIGVGTSLGRQKKRKR